MELGYNIAKFFHSSVAYLANVCGNTLKEEEYPAITMLIMKNGTTQDTSVPPDNPYRNETDNKEATQDHLHEQDRIHLRLQEEKRKDKDRKRMKYEKGNGRPTQRWSPNAPGSKS